MASVKPATTAKERIIAATLRPVATTDSLMIEEKGPLWRAKYLRAMYQDSCNDSKVKYWLYILSLHLLILLRPSLILAIIVMLSFLVLAQNLAAHPSPNVWHPKHFCKLFGAHQLNRRQHLDCM